MLTLFLLTFLLCWQQNVVCETNNIIVSPQEVKTSTYTAEEEFTPEEEELLEEAYSSLDSVEPETVTKTVEEETLPLLQEDEGFLEQLRRTPLDLNTATYLQLKSVPGITAELAREIVRRRRTRPFKSKAELKNIRGVTDEVYKKISPYLTVYRVKQPAKLKGQIRLRTKFSQPESYDYVSLKTKYIPVEKFKSQLYFYNRTQLNYGTNLSLGYVFLHRPLEIEVNTETFKYFLRKWWLRLDGIGPFDKILLGNYKAGFGYGLVFHESSAVEGFLDSVKPKMRGLREDKSTADNAYLYGIGIEGNTGMLEYSLFYSDKSLITRTIISSTTVRNESTGEETIVYDFQPSDDLLDVRNSIIEYDRYLMDYDVKIETSTFGRLPKRKIYEELIGMNLSFPIGLVKLGICGYYAQYNKPFDPDRTKTQGYNLVDKYSEKWGYVFRGDNLAVYSMYFEFPFDKLNIYGEVGQSQCWFTKTSAQTIITSQRGYGVNLGILLPVSKAKFYLLYTYLEPTFYSPLGVPIKVYDYHNNQQGIKFGTEHTIGRVNIKFSYSTAEVFRGVWSGYSTSESPRFPSKYNELVFETKYKPLNNLELYFRTIDELRERYINLKTYGIAPDDTYTQTQQLRISNRYQLSCNLDKNTSLRFRYDQRWQSFVSYGKQYYGEQLWTELKHRFWNFTINSRFCVFDSDKDVYLSYLEQQWYNLYLSETENNSSGDKFYFTVAYRFRKNTVLWLRYRYKIYAYKNDIPTWSFTSLKDTLGITDHEYRLQLDISW